jgi:hypothetical protein
MFEGHEMGERDARNETPRSEYLFLAGLCTGAVVGAGLGLLFAPRIAVKPLRVANGLSKTVEAMTHGGEEAATQGNGAAPHTTDGIGRAGAPSRVDKGLATLGEMAAAHGGDWLAATRR